MRAHQSEFAALLHNRLCFTVPSTHVTHHYCMDDPEIAIADTEEDVARMEKEFTRRPERVAREMLENNGGRLEDVHINACSYRTCYRIAKRFESLGWIRLEPWHDHHTGRPALHFTVTNERAMWKMAGGQ